MILSREQPQLLYASPVEDIPSPGVCPEEKLLDGFVIASGIQVLEQCRACQTTTA